MVSTNKITLLSKEHEDLLNIIDTLRSQGISHFIDLPQIIVCGDQSSGKSSLLEAISGLKFPTKDNLCTRFAIEVILRRGSSGVATASIVPADDCPEHEKERLSKFHHQDIKLEDLESIVNQAKVAMGIDSDTKAFSNHVLRMEVSGPRQANLTLVDLPGLFQAGTKSQTDEDATAVTSLTRSYMKKTRSIILAIISAKNDLANQIVTKYARELDPMGDRTLGIITKPDTLDEGSDSEKAFFDIAENKNIYFHHGWHVIKNRDWDIRACSLEERDRSEKDFFSTRLWSNLPESQLGVETLKHKLSTRLRDQIIRSLPDLLQEVEDGIQRCEKILENLGPSRQTLYQQRVHLSRASQGFMSLARDAINGVYNDSFFGSPISEDGYKKRLRAVIQNLMREFAIDLEHDGHANRIVNTIPEDLDDPRLITTEEYISDVVKLMKRNYGRELPSTYNPLIIIELFCAQAEPWTRLATKYTSLVWGATLFVSNSILESSTDSHTAEQLKRYVINPKMHSLRESIEEKVKSLLKNHKTGHPISYNSELVKTYQMFKQKRERGNLAKKMPEFFKKNPKWSSKDSEDMEALLDFLHATSISDPDRYAAAEVMDQMKAYYDIALKRLVDDFSVLAVEDCLLTKLPSLFSSEHILEMEDKLVTLIAGEMEESRNERARTERKLEILKKGRLALNGLDHLRPDKKWVSIEFDEDELETAENTLDTTPEDTKAFEYPPGRYVKKGPIPISNKAESAESEPAESEPTESEPADSEPELSEPSVSISAVADPATPEKASDVWGSMGSSKKKQSKVARAVDDLNGNQFRFSSGNEPKIFGSTSFNSKTQ